MPRIMVVPLRPLEQEVAAATSFFDTAASKVKLAASVDGLLSENQSMLGVGLCTTDVSSSSVNGSAEDSQPA